MEKSIYTKLITQPFFIFVYNIHKYKQKSDCKY